MARRNAPLVATGEPCCPPARDAGIEAPGELRALDTLDARVEVEVDRVWRDARRRSWRPASRAAPALDAGIEAPGELRGLDVLDAGIEAGIEAPGRHCGGNLPRLFPALTAVERVFPPPPHPGGSKWRK